MNCPRTTPITRTRFTVVMLGRGQVGATVEVGVIDLFAGLLGYICAILMLVTLRRTVLKGNGDGEVEIEIYVSSSSLILWLVCFVCCI